MISASLSLERGIRPKDSLKQNWKQIVYKEHTVSLKSNVNNVQNKQKKKRYWLATNVSGGHLF